LFKDHFKPSVQHTLQIKQHETIDYNKKLEAKYVLPNINRTQAAERAENAFFVPGDLDL